MLSFVHPQFKFNLKNIFLIKLAFFLPKNRKTEKEIKGLFPNKFVYFTDMGRTAFKVILEELNIKNGEIIMPSFTCDIFSPILKEYGLTPVFVETDKTTFNFKEDEIEEKITKNTKAILAQHTFGLACNIEKILALARKHNLKVIEDCSHAFLNKYKGKYLGLFGDASFFSLYKTFPCLRGGIVLLDKPLGKPLEKTRFSFRDYFSLLNSFAFFSFIFKTFFQEQAKKNLRQEKTTKFSALNRVSFNLFAFSFKSFEKKQQTRIKQALEIRESLSSLGFECQKKENNCFTFLSCLCPKGKNRDELVLSLRKKGVFATRIWKDPIKTNKNFPQTEEISQRIINFPQTKRIIEPLRRLF